MVVTPKGTQGVTLASYLASAWAGKRQYDGLDRVMEAIARSAREIQEQVQLAALAGVLGSDGAINVQGELVQRLDMIATDSFVKALRESGKVAAVVAEELKDFTAFPGAANAPYLVSFDPIDGSSNIDVAVTIGSIFAFLRNESKGKLEPAAILRPGRELVAAAYLVYGSSTVLVLATREGVQGFTLHAAAGEFILTHPSIRIPEACQYYSTNEGNFSKLEPATQKIVEGLRKTYSLRYVGSLVSDFHRNLLKGGVFLYPGDVKNKEGKLRLLYEAIPLAFVAQQAGGGATSGAQPILDIVPSTLHQRIPLIIGNAPQVREIEKALGGK